jgi:hypothetical protein
MLYWSIPQASRRGRSGGGVAEAVPIQRYRFAQPVRPSRQQPAGPMGVPELFRRRPHNGDHNHSVVDLPRPPGPVVVDQPGDAGLVTASPPGDHGGMGCARILGDLGIGYASAANSTIRARCAGHARTEVEHTIRRSLARSP